MSTSLEHLARLEVRDHKGKTVLAVNTGHRADSLEGLRLVKASRGSGWLWRQAKLEPWETRGVLQEDGQLVVWGETEHPLEGLTACAWPLEGDAAWSFQRELIEAWSALAAVGELTTKFDPSAVLCARDGDGWALAFVPRDLAGVLTSVLPQSVRAAWEPFLHPDEGDHSWPFTSMAFLWRSLEPQLPWEQAEESFLRQEIRDLAKSLTPGEFPPGLDVATASLWQASLGPVAKIKSPVTDRAALWRDWARTHPGKPQVAPRVVGPVKGRLKARQQRQFWRRRGTLVAVVAGISALVLLLLGSILWGVLKPDPSDTWSPEEVVAGYYQGLESLEVTTLEKLVKADKAHNPDLAGDNEQVSNLYVLMQVRLSYERVSPRIAASVWLKSGQPPLEVGKILFGLTGLEVLPTSEPTRFTATYVKWVSATPWAEGQGPGSLGEATRDELTLTKTWKGWKLSTLKRTHKPLP